VIRLALLVLLLASAACAAPDDAPQVPVANESPRPLQVEVVDRGPDGSLRRRTVELPSGARFSLDIRFGQPLDERGARFEVRTVDRAYSHSRYLARPDAEGLVRTGGRVAFTGADLGLDEAEIRLAAALAPIVDDLAASKPALADEVDPAGTPGAAVDADPKSFWRGLAPPPVQVSWAVDLAAPATVARAQVWVKCVRCGFVRVRLTGLRQPLPPAELARPGSAQAETLLGLMDSMTDAVVGSIELAGDVEDGGMLAAAPREPLAGARTIVATIIEAPENVGFYSVKLDGRWSDVAR
jgi:hypothetical protein